MLDLITLAAAKAISGGGGGGVTPEQLEVALSTKSDKPSVVSQTAPTAITLADNTEYELTEVADLTFTFPTGRFISTIHITTTDTGFQTVAFPETEKHVGEFPDIQASQEWIISVQDGIIVAAEVKQSDTVA